MNSSVREFRGALRFLEREIGIQDDRESECCSVTLSQCHVLVELGEKTSLTITALSATLGLDKSSLSRTVDKLVEAGLVIREEDPSDRRYWSLGLTAAGQARVREINRSCDVYYQTLLDQIPQEKHQAIVESFALVSQTMRRLRETTPAGCCPKESE